jgi:hypothetical protein
MMAEDMFFEGDAVFIDHGDGLISMYSQLSDLKVVMRVLFVFIFVWRPLKEFPK